MVTKAIDSGTRATSKPTSAKAKTPIVQRDTAGLIQRAQADPASLSSAEILHLQGKLGNQAIMRLLDPAAAAPTAPQGLIQRDDDDEEPLLGGSGVASDEYEGDEAEAEETQSKMDKLMEIGTKVRTFYDMHKNYKKYEQYLGNRAWGYFKKAWSWANKILGWVSKIDPTGIAKIVSKVSKAIEKIAGYVEEAFRLSDATLREQVTPLLTHELTVATVKAAVQEAVTLKNAIKTAIDAI
jgi:hypothetical protein